MSARVSLVVPVLRDAANLAALLARLPLDPAVEVVVVDGGQDDGLAPATARPDVRLVRTAPGRGRQMNAGAAAASGEWVFFLHADSKLPAGWLAGILAAAAGGAIGGWFRFAVDDAAWQARVIERGVAWRVRALRLPYGDQGIFVRRTTFEQMGGYRDWPIMEDVEFVGRLVRMGPVAEVPLPLATSSRRWRRDGWLRRSLRNLLLVALYRAGVKPATLARWY